jgi:hypothetical protein
MRRIRGSCLVSLVSTLAFALVLGATLGLGLPVAHAAPPAFRYTLADGTVLVGVPLTDEQGTLTIETSVGVVRVPKADITSIVLADAPQSGNTTQAPPTASRGVLIDAGPPPRRKSTKVIASGAGTFALFWFSSAMAASIAIVGDANGRDALYGFVPVAGPIVWANRTESKRGLGFAILDGIVQAGGLLTVGTGLVLRSYETPPRAQRVLISPHFGDGSTGIAVSVPF